MITLTDFDPWWRFAVALLIGALLGLEREFFQQKDDAPSFAGIRTFSLIALLGAVTAFLYPEYGIIPIAISLAGLIVFTSIGFIATQLQKKCGTGITTEVAAVLTFLFGALTMSEKIDIAISLSVITSILLAAKGRLHQGIRRMSSKDIFMTLQFALLTAVILPILPNRPIDPWELLNPFQIWLMVVLVSGIGFSGYVLIKFLGPSRGLNIMGILGGLASSTATTISFSSASKGNPSLSSNYARVVILASTVMFPRILFLILVIYPPLVPSISIPYAAMLTAGFIIVYVLQRKSILSKKITKKIIKLHHPLELSTAIKFGFAFAIVIVVIEVALNSFGISGVYLTSMIAGLTEMDAITLSVLNLAKNSQVQNQAAAIAILLATIMNTISKALIAFFTGSRELYQIIFKAFGLIIFVGIFSSLLVIWLF
jgi:uncharacterized membrane protein (DUF4010 family)